MEEPIITINGVQLTTAESMTMRVAIGSFLISIQSGLGDDEHGRIMTEGYTRCCNEIHRLMWEK